ncbi:MAG: synthase subunit delta [Actinomycetota bacterium]|jgi:F-type H+-transporting ATPase subunit delta
MSTSTIDAYVTSINTIASAEGVLAQVEAEFSAVVRAMDANDSLRAKLTDELLPIAVRQNIVEQLLEGKGHRITAQSLALVIGAGHARDLRTIAEKISAGVAKGQGRQVAEVRSAVALTEDQQSRLAAALAKATGSEVNLKVVVDPSVVGGIVATVGDKVIDGSVRHSLDQLKSRL